jgi:hypothetical protein
MRTPRYLPGVRNGVVAKRQGRAKNPSTSKALSMGGAGTGDSRRRRNSKRFSISVIHRGRAGGAGRHSEERGARVMWLMILIGVALAAGFVFALRSQINAYRIAQAEEQLKIKLDEYARQQRFLGVDRDRAMSASESDHAGRYGLDHLKLDRVSAQRDASARKFVSVPPDRAPDDGDQNGRLAAAGRNNSRPVKSQPRTASQAKATKLARGVKTGKAANIMNVVKLKVKNRKRQ